MHLSFLDGQKKSIHAFNVTAGFNSFMTEVGYHIETSPLICSANQWTGFYMITASVMKELNEF